MDTETKSLDPVIDDLDFIEREADAIEAGAQAAAAPPPPAPTNTAAELEASLKMVRAIAAPAFRDWNEFGQVWSDEAVSGIATSGGAVMDLHGWTMGEFWAKWGPYIGLIGALAPPSLATLAHIRDRKAAEEAAAKRDPAPVVQA